MTIEVTVTINGRRHSFTMSVNGADTILTAAERHGLRLPSFCCAGLCATCRVKCLNGAVTMSQNYALELTDLERGYILACQARPVTPTLELDYDRA